MISTIICLSVVVLDLLTKYLTVQFLAPLNYDVVIIPRVLSFSYVENKGAAFGILANNRWIFMVLSVILIVAIILVLKYSKISHPLFVFSASMILGGGIGNMLDRIFLGYVVDFIKVTFIDFPVFNIADCSVVVGTILLAVYIIFLDKSLSASKTEGKKN